MILERITNWLTGLRGNCLGTVLCLALVPIGVNGQIFSITAGAINTCTGAIVDSGGEGGPGYSNNENLTATICPDAPGDGISLNFVTFNLSLAGGSPLDQLTVYDGADASAPVLGTWTGNTLQGQIVNSSPANISGCLTLVFTSNANGTGAFAASITCYTPCEPPVAMATMGETAPALICVGEVLTFDCSASTAAAGSTITQRLWDFDDGSTGSGTSVTHAFNTPGEYVVQLTLTDNNGCANTNAVDLQIFVGTTPLFTGTTESLTICQGGTVNLQGLVTPVTWSALPTVDFGAGVYLPDNVGQTFTSQLNYGFFPPGSTLTNVNDLLGICADMEHSFMGDLVISITCPSGQNVVMHQQGGGGTFIGGANDGDDNNPVPGTCWNYCWSASATLGTFAQSAQFGATPNVMPSETGGTALVPATYASVNSLNALVGCPLNGTWTISFTDLWAIDNGFLCSWNINFNPSLYPDLVEFTPVISYDPDSMSWTGPDVVTNPADPTSATITPTLPGTYEYSFTVTDNFGCTYDTTITVTVTNAPVVEATSTLGATCSDPAQLQGAITAFPPPPPNCNYSLVLNDSFGDGWNGGANLQVVINGTSTTYAMTPGGNSSTFTISVPVGATLALIYTQGTVWNNENSFSFLNNANIPVYVSPNGPSTGTVWSGVGNCGSNVGAVIWNWTPAAGVNNPSAQNVTTQITQPTDFVVRIYPAGQPWCFTTDTIHVTPPSFLENDSIVTHVLCNGGNGSIGLITTGLGGPWNYSWVDGIGVPVQTTNNANGDLLTIGAGTYTAFITEGPNGNGCADTLTATILQPQPLEWVTVPSDTLICLTGSGLLTATAQGGAGTIALQWTQGLVGNGPHSVSPPTSTTFGVQAIDANGCTTNIASALVNVNLPLTLTPLVPDSECVGTPYVFTAMGAAGGDGQFTYDWGNGPVIANSATFNLPLSDSVCVTLRDGCETPPISSCAWLEILHTPPLVLTADTTFGCEPFSVRFALQDTTRLASVLWNFGHGVPFQAMDSVIHTYPLPGNYTVGITVTWPNGCVTDTSIANMVRVISVPIAAMTWLPRPPSINAPTVHFRDQSLPNVTSWSWDFGAFGTSEEQDPVIEFPGDIGGSYPVMLVVANELGCTDTLRSWVDVMDEFLVWVPNAFTPDGNEHNQTFFVSGNDLSPENYELIIFDRWGGEVFHSTKLGEPWDGTSGGTEVSQGVYVWRLKVHSLSSRKKKILYGHVTLLR